MNATGPAMGVVAFVLTTNNIATFTSSALRIKVGHGYFRFEGKVSWERSWPTRERRYLTQPDPQRRTKCGCVVFSMMFRDRVILYDGICNLCTGSVQFVLKRDRKGFFKFSALQSEAGRQLLAACGEYNVASETIILIDEAGCHGKSDAVLRILRHLSGAWPILSLFLFLPKGLRDRVYDLVAKNRMRWFGKRETCMISLSNHSDRFIA